MLSVDRKDCQGLTDNVWTCELIVHYLYLRKEQCTKKYEVHCMKQCSAGQLHEIITANGTGTGTGRGGLRVVTVDIKLPMLIEAKEKPVLERVYEMIKSGGRYSSLVEGV